MYAKSTRASAKREVQKERSAKRDDRIARPRRAQTCERSELRALRMCPRSGQIFSIYFSQHGEKYLVAPTLARVRATKRNSKLWTG